MTDYPLAERPTRRPTFDPTINLGHILTFVGFIATGFGAYSTLDKRLTVQEAKVETAALAAREQELRMKELLGEIRSDLKDTRRAVDDLVRNVNAKPPR